MTPRPESENILIRTACTCSPMTHTRMLTAAHYVKQLHKGNYPDAHEDVYQEQINGDVFTQQNSVH